MVIHMAAMLTSAADLDGLVLVHRTHDYDKHREVPGPVERVYRLTAEDDSLRRLLGVLRFDEGDEVVIRYPTVAEDRAVVKQAVDLAARLAYLRGQANADELSESGYAELYRLEAEQERRKETR